MLQVFHRRPDPQSSKALTPTAGQPQCQQRMLRGRGRRAERHSPCRAALGAVDDFIKGADIALHLPVVTLQIQHMGRHVFEVEGKSGGRPPCLNQRLSHAQQPTHSFGASQLQGWPQGYGQGQRDSDAAWWFIWG